MGETASYIKYLTFLDLKNVTKVLCKQFFPGCQERTPDAGHKRVKMITNNWDTVNLRTVNKHRKIVKTHAQL